MRLLSTTITNQLRRLLTQKMELPTVVVKSLVNFRAISLSLMVPPLLLLEKAIAFSVVTLVSTQLRRLLELSLVRLVMLLLAGLLLARMVVLVASAMLNSRPLLWPLKQ